LIDLFSEEFEDVLTVGVLDPYWGTKIVSLVRSRPGNELRPTNELREACKGKMDLKRLQREAEEKLAAV
jgi:fatty-acyl-CoA synthase